MRNERKNLIVGIIKEENEREKRAPIVPADVRWLTDMGIEFEVESSLNRIFSDKEYSRAGAKIVKRVRKASFLVGVKAPSPSNVISGKIYMIFSHTVKGQKDNISLLKEMMKKRVTLLDYEKIRDSRGKRLVFFGRYAGICGFVDSLSYYGKKMKHVGINIPENFPKTDSKHFIEICRAEMLNAVNNGHDGAFLASDEGIDFITHDLFKQNLIPEKFKLITLNGQGEALLCHHPITCVNHATQEVTNVLLDHLKKISKNLKPTPIKRLITPDLYLNKTIGKININLTEELIWQY